MLRGRPLSLAFERQMLMGKTPKRLHAVVIYLELIYTV